MPDSQTDGESAPIDGAALAVISNGDAATERRLLGVFRKANAEDATMLKVAIERRDAFAVTCAAHRVVGACRIVGATTLAAICSDVARAGQAGDWDAIAAIRDDLCHELERVSSYLEIQLGFQSGARQRIGP